MNVQKLGILLGVGVSLLSFHLESVRAQRLKPYEPKNQTGIITKLVGDSAWVRMPNRAKQGATVDFAYFSDAKEIIASGRVQWAAPVAPYDLYITGIKLKVQPASETDGLAAQLAIGLYAKTAQDAHVRTPNENDGEEPVQANIVALKAINTALAKRIATAAESAQSTTIDYTKLMVELKPFAKLNIEDPVTKKLLQRLQDLIVENGGITEKVSSDFLKPTEASSLSRSSISTSK